MKISLKTTDPAALKTPALIIFIFTEDKKNLDGRPELNGLKNVLGPRLSGDFSAKFLSVLPLFLPPKLGPERIILVGLGDEKDYSPARLRTAAARAAQETREMSLRSAALLLPPRRGNMDTPEEIAENAALGVRLGMYQFNELKTKGLDGKKPLGSLTLIRSEPMDANRIKQAVETARIVSQAVFLARDLTNRPANLLYPEVLAEQAAALAGETGLECTVMDMDEARQRGMGAFVAVAQGSERPGRVIIMEYKGAAKNRKPLALVGKAVTFDTGGISIKPSENMMSMKTDMAGGAVVLAVMGAAAQLKLKINLIGVVPAVENMPAGRAYRPGDVLTSMSGQTIEVVSTDAEGRLILADALTMVQDRKPGAIIDLATLTGACKVALGHKCAGLFGNDRDLLEGLKAASEKTGELIWEMPVFDYFLEDLKSDSADIKNAGQRMGGASQAAIFLKQFVNDVPWAHLDIAGPARVEKGTPDIPAGASGFGTYLLLNYLINL